MALIFAGYFPKRIALRDEWLKAPGVREIWSGSDCISKSPSDWIDKWRHNALWLFDSPEIATSVLSSEEAKTFTIVGYRVWDRMFDDGRDVVLPVETPVLPEPGIEYVSIGFDAVGRSHDSFEHSPLSCNGGAETFPTNDACLFRTLEEAIAGAKEFSTGSWEPGPYWVVEVLSNQRGTAEPRVAADRAAPGR
jgi:hypothetical protein